MYIFIRSNGANPDPRLQKYIDYAEHKHIPYKVIAWDRMNENLSNKNYIYYKRETPFGKGVYNIPAKIFWCYFLIKQLIKNRGLYSIIHACDIDTAAPSYLIKKILNKKLTFDVFDWISTTDQKNIVFKIIKKIENYLFLKTDIAIICEEYRIEQVEPRYKREFLTLPNIPHIDFVIDNEVVEKCDEYKKGFKYSLSYVGVFDNNRGLEDILLFVSNSPDVSLHIAGFGLNEKLVEEYAKQFNNIFYWGKVSYNRGLNIMNGCDFIVGLYYLKNPVHKYAAPNKYYESLFLGKPIITNYGTSMADRVEEEQTGLLIDETSPEFEKIYLLSLEDLEILKENASTIWNQKYKYYTESFMDNYFISK